MYQLWSILHYSLKRVFSTRGDQERNKKGFLGAAQLYTLRQIPPFLQN